MTPSPNFSMLFLTFSAGRIGKKHISNTSRKDSCGMHAVRLEPDVSYHLEIHECFAGMHGWSE